MEKMKKLLMGALLMFLATFNANAQFEKGVWYANASLTSLDVSHSKHEGSNFGFGVTGGKFVADNISVLFHYKGQYVEHGLDETSLGVLGRYYCPSCGVYGGLGLAYKHLSGENFRKDLVCLTPELGYAFFLGRNVTVEPAVYYDVSLREASQYSKLGFKIGFGLYF